MEKNPGNPLITLFTFLIGTDFFPGVKGIGHKTG